MKPNFNQIRREAGITSVEYADFTGMSRLFMRRVESGHEIATDGMLSALYRMIQQNTACPAANGG
jgi:predicted transcriptional regulator